MAEGSVIVVGGTRGIGREIAAVFADRGRDVFVTGRDAATARQVAEEIGGNARGLALDLAHPREIADRLRDVGRVEHLVLVAIDRDANTARDYDIEGALATMRAAGPPDIDEAMLGESLVTPTDAATVARFFEDRATSGDA